MWNPKQWGGRAFTKEPWKSGDLGTRTWGIFAITGYKMGHIYEFLWALCPCLLSNVVAQKALGGALAQQVLSGELLRAGAGTLIACCRSACQITEFKERHEHPILLQKWVGIGVRGIHFHSTGQGRFYRRWGIWPWSSINHNSNWHAQSMYTLPSTALFYMHFSNLKLPNKSTKPRMLFTRCARCYDVPHRAACKEGPALWL